MRPVVRSVSRPAEYPIQSKYGSSFSWSQYWAIRFPSGLTITPISDTQATWNWTNNGVADYDDIRLERGTTLLNFAEIDDVALGTTTYADGGMTPQTYYFRLRYRSGTHYSAYSNVATITETDFYVGMGSIITEADEAFLMESNEYIIQE